MGGPSDHGTALLAFERNHLEKRRPLHSAMPGQGTQHTHSLRRLSDSVTCGDLRPLAVAFVEAQESAKPILNDERAAVKKKSSCVPRGGTLLQIALVKLRASKGDRMRSDHRSSMFAVTIGLACWLSANGGCASPVWNGSVRQWGTLREVLHDGNTAGRVRVVEALTKGHGYGIGAPAALAGEILIFDGSVYVARMDGSGDVSLSDEVPPTEEAALLAVAFVPTWSNRSVDHTVPADEFEEFVRDNAIASGLDPSQTFPFVVEGRFGRIQLHILNGRCPFAETDGSQPAETEPYRAELTNVSGRLIGFFAEHATGVLTHHGSRTHVHALLLHGDPPAGHVDAVQIEAGSIIRFPAVRKPHGEP